MTLPYNSLYQRISELAKLTIREKDETIKIIECFRKLWSLRYEYITVFPYLVQEERIGLDLLLDQTRSILDDRIEDLKVNEFLRINNWREMKQAK